MCMIELERGMLELGLKTHATLAHTVLRSLTRDDVGQGIGPTFGGV